MQPRLCLVFRKENFMSYDNLIKSHYEELNNLSIQLRTYMEIYRLLISSTSELNNTSIIKKGELKHAVERIDCIGDIIDDLLKVIRKCENSYCTYCLYKNEVVINKTEKGQIMDEIHNELVYHSTNK